MKASDDPRARTGPAVRIRRAAPFDAEVAAAIIAAALAEHGLPFEPTGRDADVAAFGARADHDDLVAVGDEGRAIGIVSVGPHGAPGVAWISKLFVAKSARQRGIGRALLHHAEDAARSRGFRSVGLRSRTVFRAALALYESEGYVVRDEGPRLSPGDVVYFRPL